MVEAGTQQLDPDRVVEARTVLGPLLVEKDAEVLTRSLLEVGMWDQTISGLMENVLRPGMTFVDAGANIGWFSVLGSRLVGPTGHVFSVEPDPVNLSILRANLERNGCSNVSVVPVAAWSERTELDFARPPEEGAVARVGQDDGSGQRVPADRLDALIEGPIDYIKVDCELSDHVVVQGAEGLLRRNPAMLISVEFHPWHESHLGDRPPEILDRYRDMGLHPYEIVRKGIRATTWEEIASPDLLEGHISFDFVLSRRDNAELKTRGLIARKGLLERQGVDLAKQKLLRAAGDLLEFVPQPIRPPIRHRDRPRRKRF
ncbi:MAG: FkbM family methyltransferase [Solirubrobacterales bacterium]